MAEEKEYSIEKLTPSQLVEAFKKAVDVEKKWKRHKALLALEFARRFGARMLDLLVAKGKEYGSATDKIEGQKLKLEVEQDVKWDSKALSTIADEFGLETAQKVLKVELSVSEAVFNAVTDDALKAALIKARTVTLKPAKVTPVLEEPKEETATA